VSLWVSTVLVAVIATICIVAYVEFEEFHLRNIDRTLSAMAKGILASLHERMGEEQMIDKDIHAVTGNSAQNPSTFYRIWMDGASADLSASDPPTSERGRWLRELPVQNTPLRGQVTFFSSRRREDEYRAVWTRQEVEAGVVNVVVADSSHYTYHEMDEFLRLMLVLGGSLIVGSAVLVTLGVRWALGPIDAAAEQLHRIRQPNVAKVSFDNEKAPEELRPFIRALTEMLHRLDSVFERQKRFTADAAHELRTPLAVAKSTLQAAQAPKRRGCEHERAIGEALEDIVRMEYLIGQLLFLARMDGTDEGIATSEVQFDVLLRELAEALSQKMKRSGGKVILEELPVVTICGNLDELIRLFNNVLDNAARYGPSGGTVRITLKCEPDGYATVRIHDEGGNIPPEALPHLFDRFYRVDHSRSSSTGGVGLGLAIAREIARRHNGDISITSEPGYGTLVCIRLPRT
jgi:signal transduction histidine kinase